ncbi:MAG: OB-fold nucleic acid binding domain-containing protein [Actinomycetaceae bacterium]|nr:OB-fold nucleic acid binding domain-containing protein [Actinomycetaceae bacterium]
MEVTSASDSPHRDGSVSHVRPVRERTTVTGRVVAITYPSRRATACLQAHLQDESGTLIVSWSGRRDIPGIRVGQTLTVTGVIGMRDSQHHMYNPHYEIVADGASL